jgi:Do/DeqQ family serine protease
LLFALAIAAAVSAPVAAQQRVVPQSEAEITLSYAPLVRRVAPAVVNIYAKSYRRAERSPLFADPLFERYFGDIFPESARPPRNSLGSGVIVRMDGLIVTNNHVIEGADEIIVILSDRREFAATVLRTDARTDLAILQIEPPKGERLPFLELGDSDALEVGDLVLAIGNPFGVGQTVTSGIVSALGRTAVDVSDYQSFIQTDAAINPGNSGGALVSMDGRLAGINTMIFTRTGASSGVGFAIPADLVATVVSGVTTGDRLVRLWLGAKGQDMTAELAQTLGMARPVGVLINSVHPSGPAAEAGVRLGDVIFAVDGHEVVDAQALRYRIATHAAGEEARLSVFRKGEELTLVAPLSPAPEDPPRHETELAGQHPMAGATIANLSPALAEELSGMGVPDSGVIVMAIRRASAAALVRFRPGDVVVAINGEDVSRVRDVQRLLERQRREWRITVRRGDQLVNILARQ